MKKKFNYNKLYAVSGEVDLGIRQMTKVEAISIIEEHTTKKFIEQFNIFDLKLDRSIWLHAYCTINTEVGTQAFSLEYIPYNFIENVPVFNLFGVDAYNICIVEITPEYIVKIHSFSFNGNSTVLNGMDLHEN